jgi:MraZ protein
MTGEVDGLPGEQPNSILDTMLMGTYNQSMDAKGRMSFPAKLREALGEKFIITKGIDGCLFVYDTQTFEKKAEKIQSLPMSKARALQRSFMAWACEAEPDKQGRVLVPQSLREAAGLDKEIVVAGVCDRCEIWDKKRWDEINSGGEDELLEALEGLDF